MAAVFILIFTWELTMRDCTGSVQFDYMNEYE